MAFVGSRSQRAESPGPGRAPRLEPVVRPLRALLRAVWSAPLVTTYAATLLATTLVLRHVTPATAEQLLSASSTDVAHLLHDPVVVLVLSAFWLPGRLWVPEALVLFAVAAPLERRFGAGRAALVFLSGHVLATLLTELPIGAAIAAGWLGPEDAHRLDVGASYGLMAVIVAYAGGLGVLRGLAVFLVGGFLVVGVPRELDMTTYGHLLAALIGICWWPTLHRRFSWRRRARPRLRA